MCKLLFIDFIQSVLLFLSFSFTSMFGTCAAIRLYDDNKKLIFKTFFFFTFSILLICKQKFTLQIQVIKGWKFVLNEKKNTF